MIVLVRGSTDRVKLDWNKGRATGPDGTEYAIQTERPLHEGTIHFPLVKHPGDRSMRTLTGAGGPYGYEETVRDAKKVCEYDAWVRAGRPS